MNSSATDISSYLASVSSLVLTETTNLFIGREPDTPDEVVTVFDTGGGELSSGTEKNEFPTVQVRVRGVRIIGYADAYSTTEDIKNTLHKLATTINSTVYQGIWASSDIIFLGHDDNDRAVFTINFRIQRTA
ncbi:MAG: hypothetical protein GY821_12630 [Gammaproteobacteria bacterium]|nr:hypothetical protein [Gammaproteobacteria bacterium]